MKLKLLALSKFLMGLTALAGSANAFALNPQILNALFSKIKRWVGSSPQSHHSSPTIDVEHHAFEYLLESLVKLFLKSGLDDEASKILAKGYVVDVKKMRRDDFRYWRPS